MTKEITKANILQEMQDKLGLREFEPSKFLFSEEVVPVYDIGAQVKHWESDRSRTAISGNGTTVAFTVPENERWRVRKLDVFNESGGNFKVTHVFMYGSATKNQYIYYSGTGISAGAMTLFSLVQDIFMESAQLNTLQFTVASFVGGGWVSIHMLKEVETLR